MSYQEDMLKRAGIKYFGIYLLEGALPGPKLLEHDETEKEMRDKAYSVLMERMEGIDKAQAAKIREAAVTIDSESERAGFANGMKVGARLILNLLDGGEIVF